MMMRLYLTADSVTVEQEEQGIELVIETEGGDTVRVNVQACVFDFHRAFMREVHSYVLEAEHARRSLPIDSHDADLGYALDDPKHPTYHERMAGHWDSREGK